MTNGTAELDVRRLAQWAGPVAIAIAFVGIIGSTLLAPEFSWTGNALSDLGARGQSTAPLFNWSLIVAGVVGLPFAWRVWIATERALQRVGVAVIAASLVAMALVGVFPLPAPAHGPVAIAFFLSFTYGLFLVGSGDVLAGRPRRGLAAIWLGVAHPTAWIVSLALGVDGIAIPEFVGSVLLAAWVLIVFRSLRR